MFSNGKSIYIHDNTFNLLQQSNHNNNNWGIHLEASRDYTIEDNKFTGGYQKADGSYKGTPIYTKESANASICYIKNNEIGDSSSKFDFGIFCEGDNPTLQVVCNDFADNSMEIGIQLEQVQTADKVIAQIQGNCNAASFVHTKPETLPAGNAFASNSFNTPNVGQHRQINAASANIPQITYNYYPVDGPPDVSYTLGVVTPNTSCNSVTYKKNCAYKTPYTPPPACNLAVINIMSRNFDSLELQIRSSSKLLTNYNREDVSNKIENVNDLKELVEIIKPFDVYLSDKELIVLMSKLGKFDTNSLLDIIEENSPIGSTVLDAFILSISNNLTPLETRKFGKRVFNIKQNYGTISLREELELEIYANIRNQNLTSKAQIASCWREGNKSDIIEQLQYMAKRSSQNSNYFRELLVNLLIDEKEYDKALSELEQFKIDEDKKLAKLTDLKKYHLNMLTEGRSVYELNKKDISTLQSLSDTLTIAGIQARNILLAHYDSTAVFSLPEVMYDEKLRINQQIVDHQTSKKSTLVYPNPSKNKVFYYRGNEKNIKMFELFNVTGILINTEQITSSEGYFDATDLANGTYIIKWLNNSNMLIGTDKIIIAK